AQLLDLVRAGRKQHRGAGRLYRAAQDPVGHRLSALGRLLPGRAANAPRAARVAVPRGEAPGARRRRPRLLWPELTQRRQTGPTKAAPTSWVGRMTERIRIAVLNCVHETVTFLPNDTTLDDFVHAGSPARG